MELARLDAPEPRKGHQRVRIVFEVNNNEYHSEIVVNIPEPLVQIIIEDVPDDETRRMFGGY